MQNRAIICTHHKTGSVWMRKTFQRAAEEFGIAFTVMKSAGLASFSKAQSGAIIFDGQSHWFRKRRGQAEPSDRALHVIRDPRDIIISGAEYHRTSKEIWLQTPDAKFNGRSYQEAINDFSTPRERLLFEMEHSPGAKQVASWNPPGPHCFESKYEDLIEDADNSLARQIAAHLGFDDCEAETIVSLFYRNSLAGGTTPASNPTHIRNGKPRQWQLVFDRDLALAFLARYPEALERLGYEPNASWADNF